MANADENNQTPSTDANKALEGFKTEVDKKLSDVADLIKQQNEQFSTALRDVVTSVKPKAKEVDIDPYDSAQRKDEIERTAARIASEALTKERALNSKIYELSQSYPEVMADDKVKEAVMKNHKGLRQDLQGTPEGYEMAVLKAVADSGLVPKSKRQQVDQDVSGGAGRGAGERSSGSKKAKVTDTMLAFAELLGRPVDDPEYLKRLEKAASREKWLRYE